MQRVTPTATRSRAWVIWMAVDIVAALFLTGFAYLIGQMLALGSWGGANIRLLLGTRTWRFAAPYEWLLALAETAPLESLAGLLMAVIVVSLATCALLQSAPRRTA